MKLPAWLHRQLRIRTGFATVFIAIVVAAHGTFIWATTLTNQLAVRHGSRLTAITIDIPLLIGVSLIYLASLLRRRKRSAWFVTVLAYMFYLGLAIERLLPGMERHHFYYGEALRTVALPVLVLLLLFAYERLFVVRSDIRSLSWAARFSIIVLVVTLIYGVAGFLLLDTSDFHQEIGVASAVHYTVDQFDLTTNRPLHPYTKRAQLFVDSLSFISVSAVAFVAFSLAQPLRLRLTDQTRNRQHMLELLQEHHGRSEEFFKLWPHDKQYFFNDRDTAGLAFHVSRGVAVVLGDPAGKPSTFRALLRDFNELCYGNDWLPVFVHVEETHQDLYLNQDFELQRIGQEAVIDLANFETNVAHGKYFRQIQNKFQRQGFTSELLKPPHHPAVLDRLSVISHDWLKRGGRSERGFAMGYYSAPYMQQCEIMVARDAAGTIQAFINKLPAEFDREEADFDLLRHTGSSPSNVNDFLLMNFIGKLRSQGYARLNLGLCPLAGLDKETDSENSKLIDGAMRFVYANGNRLYSFEGLYRFKKKYQPEWRDRFVAYRGGLRGFSRSMTGLMHVMRVSKTQLYRSEH